MLRAAAKSKKKLTSSSTPSAELNPSGHLTHFDSAGHAHMVDIGEKPDTLRMAVATGLIKMEPATFQRVQSGTAAKGDVIGIARVAAIQASKRTADLIPLCHPIALSKVSVDFELLEHSHQVQCTATVHCTGKTGVEMEALTAVQVGLLTIYDMCKAVDRGMQIDGVRLLEKHGGKSGSWVARPRANGAKKISSPGRRK